MFNKEKELVEIGPDSYNLKEGGEGGFDYILKNKLQGFCDPEIAKKGNAKQAEVMRSRYGVNFRKIMSANGNATSIKRQKFLGTGMFDSAIRERGRSLSNTLEAKEKRKSTYQQINHQQGERNSQYGTMWITDGTANRKIQKEEVIPEGWRKGRVTNAGCDGHRLVS